MPDYLVLDWEQQQLCGIDAQAGRGSARIRRCFRLQWPEGGSPADDPQSAGKWLGGELRKLAVTARQVLVSLPREDAVVRQLELPNAPDDELADLVNLQAETKTASSLDKLLLDYLPLPVLGGSATRHVLMATISRDASSRIRSVLAGASLELASIGLSAAGVAELVAAVEERRGLDAGDPSLFISRHDGRFEIALIRDRRLLFSHSTRLGGENDEENTRLVLAEVSRSFVSLEQLLSGSRVARCWVAGAEGENQGLRVALAGRLDGEVLSLDPLADAGVSVHDPPDAQARAALAGPVGMLLAAAEPRVEHVDFLHPRKAVPKTDRRKVRNRAIAIAAASLVLCGLVGAHLHVRNQDSTLTRLNRQNSQLDRELKQGQPTMAFASIIRGWTSKRNNWPDEFVQFNKASPGGDRVFLLQYQGYTGADKTDTVGRTHLIGLAIEREDVSDLSQRFVDRGHRVEPPKITDDRTDPKYKVRFEMDVEWKAARGKPKSRKPPQKK